jgi:Putative prokaryotic signal transducing protein
MEQGEGVVLTVVSGETEGDIVQGLLQSAGIDSAWRDTEAIDSPLEEFTAAGPREILVREADLEAARQLLAESRSD